MSDLRDRAHATRRALPRGTISTLLKLLLISFLVGIALTVLGIDPVNLWRGLWNAAVSGISGVFDFGTDGVMAVLALVLTGAVIVVPIFLVRLLLRERR